MQISISIPADDDGYILLQCEHCGEYFKLLSGDIKSEEILEIICPACGLASENYLTQDVIKLAMNMVENKVNDLLHDSIKRMERNTKNSMFEIKVRKNFEHKSEEPIRAGIEAMEVVTFPCCHKSAKVKPLLKFTGCYCPCCGVKKYEIN